MNLRKGRDGASLVCFRGQVSIKLLLQAASHISETCYDAARQVGLKVDAREREVQAGSVSITPSLVMIRSTSKAKPLPSSSPLTTHHSLNSTLCEQQIPGGQIDLTPERLRTCSWIGHVVSFSIRTHPTLLTPQTLTATIVPNIIERESALLKLVP